MKLTRHYDGLGVDPDDGCLDKDGDGSLGRHIGDILYCGCPQCKYEQPRQNLECAKCGIIFEKYLARQKLLSENRVNASPSPAENIDTGPSSARSA